MTPEDKRRTQRVMVAQGGGDMLRSQGLRVESLAKIASMDDHGLKFC